MVEFALSVALIALIAIPSVKVLGKGVADTFYKSSEEVAGAGAIVNPTPIPCPPGNPFC